MRLLEGGTVVDADGVLDADVLIDGDTIELVGDASDATVDERVDVSGQFVVPGMIDTHVHLMMDARPDAESLQGDSEATMAYRAAENLRKQAKAGVTTTRDLGAAETLAIDAREAVADGQILGPRVQSAGKNVVMTGGHGHWFGREADGPHEVRKAVREQLKAGADAIKCMATGGVLTTGAQTGAPELTPEELEALVDTADAAGVPTAAHCHGTQGIKNAVLAGIDSVEHGTFMDEQAAELMADRDTYWVPTLSALKGIVENRDAGIPEQAVEKGEDAAQRMAAAWEYALDAGVPIAMGTDAGTPFNRHEDAAHELAYMVEYGLDAEGALEAATVNAADLLGLDDTGLIEKGHRSDLLVLPENPLEDVLAWQSPEQVYVAGEQVR
ncbi:metal-dependent hydrolase family protein [Halolamina salifodinae]|uniref:Imidazolonepropionase-like amidohydrolase n=1 Tax=Halolamina salifodinae TaxID=1202767 RepID=A0A8T4GX86_9EURY|nr:amidohydrolase family protein [Halolamina salifodinae]MBP1987721.1 imidazolonepropionase-like amidohydrolase [Halolamina salifodinae]